MTDWFNFQKKPKGNVVSPVKNLWKQAGSAEHLKAPLLKQEQWTQNWHQQEKHEVSHFLNIFSYICPRIMEISPADAYVSPGLWSLS